ncbi:MAG: DNA repair protein RecN, partial [Actinobacteria bacterium]|nr:DNA repair protein RecN [Actinomycetota bacterium]
MSRSIAGASLLELRVTDLGIIEELSVLLERGLTVVSGETGAGKTLVMTALALLGGARADSSMVRAGASEARIEGRFFDPAIEDEIVLVRVVPLDGRSRAYVNGGLVTIGELSERCGSLVDLHGQHSHQSLLDPAIQTNLLDRFSGDPASRALADYRSARSKLSEAQRKLDDLGGDERARAREMDLLKFQIDELVSASLSDPD